jgi:hypothetical protein
MSHNEDKTRGLTILPSAETAYTKKQEGICILPMDDILYVLQFLCLSDIINLICTSREHKKLCDDELVWQQIYYVLRKSKQPLSRPFVFWKRRVKQRVYFDLQHRIKDVERYSISQLQDKAQNKYINWKHTGEKLYEKLGAYKWKKITEKMEHEDQEKVLRPDHKLLLLFMDEIEKQNMEDEKSITLCKKYKRLYQQWQYYKKKLRDRRRLDHMKDVLFQLDSNGSCKRRKLL